MKSFIIVCAVYVLSGRWVSADTDGVGAFSYQDSSGNRIHPYFPPPTFIRPPSFIRRPYIPIINRTFKSKSDQSSAFDAARKAFDLTSNHIGYIPNFESRFQAPLGNNFGGFENMPWAQGFPNMPGFQFPDFGRNANSAFASSAIGPDFSEQAAAISPPNPNNPNINKVNRISSGGPGGPGNYKFVSSSVHVSSSIGPDGKPTSSRSAQTTINNNGDEKTYTVKS